LRISGDQEIGVKDSRGSENQATNKREKRSLPQYSDILIASSTVGRRDLIPG
jgi:hypothetical protein